MINFISSVSFIWRHSCRNPSFTNIFQSIITFGIILTEPIAVFSIQISFWQIIATLVYILTFANSIGLYASIIAITCSQLEKLRSNLLDIRQKPETSEQDSGVETDPEVEETQAHTSQEVFRRMQRQLNDCVRHHQQIIRYLYYLRHPTLLLSYFRPSKGDDILLRNVSLFSTEYLNTKLSHSSYILWNTCFHR
jgi:hypothetical protein